MCAPAALMVMSMAMSAMGAMQQAQAANDAADYEKAVQRNNNVMAERAKADTLQRGKREEVLRRHQITQDVATKKSQLSASGFDVNTGSALTAQSDVAAMGQVEALTIRSNTQREAYGIDVGNNKERAESGGRVMGFKNQAKASLISGASSVISAGYKGYSSGAFGK